MVAETIGRYYKPVIRRFFQMIRRDPITHFPIEQIEGLVKVGSEYGGWIIPRHLVFPDAVCYCAGVGEDITFDLGLIRQYGCKVFAIDPTPRAARHVDQVASGEANFTLLPVGLWDKEERVRFYEPKDPTHVSHSILNLQQTDRYFEADCRRLASLMVQLGHSRLDLLKIDIEGAEYGVLNTIVEDDVKIGVLCVEFDEIHTPMDAEFSSRIRRSICAILDRGFRLVAVDGDCNYTFVASGLLAP